MRHRDFLCPATTHQHLPAPGLVTRSSGTGTCWPATPPLISRTTRRWLPWPGQPPSPLPGQGSTSDRAEPILSTGLRHPVRWHLHRFAAPPRTRPPNTPSENPTLSGRQQPRTKNQPAIHIRKVRSLRGAKAQGFLSSEPTAFRNIRAGTTCDPADVFLRSGFYATTPNVLPFTVPLPEAFLRAINGLEGDFGWMAGCSTLAWTTPPWASHIPTELNR